MKLWEDFCFWIFETLDSMFGDKEETKTYETFEVKEGLQNTE